MTKAIEKKKSENNLLNFIKSDNFKTGMGEVLPKHLTADRMVRVAITAMTKTPLLRQCTKESFVKCMMELSQLGLEPDGRRAHLIPFKNHKQKIVECTLIVDYKGLVSLIMQTGLVSRIHADVVCENDVFVYNLGSVERHEINFQEDRGAPYAAYCIIEMKDGSKKCEVMDRQQIAGIRARSKAADSGPWVTDPDEMAKKTVFRRAAKWVSWDSIEATPEVQTAQKAFEADNLSFVDMAGPQDLETPKNIEQLTEAMKTNKEPEPEHVPDDLGY